MLLPMRSCRILFRSLLSARIALQWGHRRMRFSFQYARLQLIWIELTFYPLFNSKSKSFTKNESLTKICLNHYCLIIDIAFNCSNLVILIYLTLKMISRYYENIWNTIKAPIKLVFHVLRKKLIWSVIFSFLRNRKYKYVLVTTLLSLCKSSNEIYS